jgi:hypothetical protein
MSNKALTDELILKEFEKGSEVLTILERRHLNMDYWEQDRYIALVGFWRGKYRDILEYPDYTDLTGWSTLTATYKVKIVKTPTTKMIVRRDEKGRPVSAMKKEVTDYNLFDQLGLRPRIFPYSLTAFYMKEYVKALRGKSVTSPLIVKPFPPAMLEALELKRLDAELAKGG